MAALMFCLTSLVVVLVPLATEHDFNTGQKTLLTVIVGMGYMTTALYLYTYRQNSHH